MPQLDALRAFAVLGVLVHHLLGTENLPVGIRDIPYGFLGVRLFYVLSGFLITGILLRSRDAVDAGGRSRWLAIRQFYIRRLLRIFPLYYFVVALLFALDLPPTREVIFWLLTYTYNVQLSIQGWLPENLAHFWTLSVEEQYYLVWPWLVLFGPRNKPGFIAAIVLVGPAFRLFAAVQQWNGVAMYYLTPANLDTLGMGSLLAVFSRPHLYAQERVRRFLKYGAIAGAALAIVVNALLSSGIDWIAYTALFDMSAGLMFSWLIYHASRGFGGRTGRVLESKPLVYCGKITYGIYVYHLFIPYLLSVLCGVFDVDYPTRGFVNFVVASAVTFGVASLSWHLFEQPINKMKRYFEFPLGAEERRSEAQMPAP